MGRTTLRQRIADYLDRQVAEADAQASARGLAVDVRTRYGRTYSDPRTAALRLARASGCFCVPMCADLAGCPMRQGARASSDLRKVA